MPLHLDYTTPMYEKELRRLKALGLIEDSVGTFMHYGDDAHKYLAITKEGIKYLEVKAEESKDIAVAASDGWLSSSTSTSSQSAEKAKDLPWIDPIRPIRRADPFSIPQKF